MTTSEDAAENLRVIRGLMERATVYRAISAPTAVFAALLAIPIGAWLALMPNRDALTPMVYFWTWVAVYLIIDVFNFALLWRDAKKRGAPMLTQNLYHAVMSIGPPIFVGGIVSLLVVHESVLMATLCWVLFYGLGLLATHSFSPRSMKILGLLFVVSGLAIAIAWRFELLCECTTTASWIMAATFGGYHLAYGLVIGLKTRFRISGGQ